MAKSNEALFNRTLYHVNILINEEKNVWMYNKEKMCENDLFYKIICQELSEIEK